MTPPAPALDWQFWIVTAVASLAALWVLRYIWRIAAPRKRSRTRAVLTVEGKPPRSV